MAAFAPPCGRGYPLGVSVPLLRCSLASGRRLRQKLLRCIAHRARSQFLPWAALYRLPVPTAWPPALRAESGIPPPASGRPPPFPKGGLGATDYSLSRGPKGSLEPAGWPPLARKSFQPSAFRILSPFPVPVAYSESGAQPSAIQALLSRTRLRAPARPGCRAPREARRFAEPPTALPGGERRLGTGRETSGGPSRSPPALTFDSEGARGPPRSIFGHFLLIKKVAASAQADA